MSSIICLFQSNIELTSDKTNKLAFKIDAKPVSNTSELTLFKKP